MQIDLSRCTIAKAMHGKNSSQLFSAKQDKTAPLRCGTAPLKSFLSFFLVLCVCVSCGGGSGSSDDRSGNGPPPGALCDISSLEAAQRATGYDRDNYSPKVNSYDFLRDLGAEYLPKTSHYHLARKVSRSVFKIEFRKEGRDEGGHVGTGWLVAPGYIVTAAHNVVKNYIERPCIALGGDIVVHTFDGETRKAELVWHDSGCVHESDLAVLKLAEGEEKITAVPMKIATEDPEEKKMLFAMGAAQGVSALGAWTVTAGPMLEVHPHRNAVWLYHQVPALSGMSGGPIFNRKGEVVSIVGSSADPASNDPRSDGGRKFYKIKPPPPFENEDLFWIYGFEQRNSDKISEGPDPERMRQLFDDIPDLSEPENAGVYEDDNKWERAEHPLGEHYSPFPVNRFDEMKEVFKEARKGTVEIKVAVGKFGGGGSGFIYDDSTVITAAHVVEHERVEADRITIKTRDGKSYPGEVIKKEFNRTWLDGCDIAVIKTAPGALSGYKKLAIADSSPSCGDPLVQIGSADVYNPVGSPQGLAVVYTRETRYTSEFLSRSAGGGMSGGPVVNSAGEVVTVSSTIFGRGGDQHKPGHLYIHTWLPIYSSQEAINGTNAKTIKRIIEEDSFRCQKSG